MFIQSYFCLYSILSYLDVSCVFSVFWTFSQVARPSCLGFAWALQETWSHMVSRQHEAKHNQRGFSPSPHHPPPPCLLKCLQDEMLWLVSADRGSFYIVLYFLLGCWGSFRVVQHQMLCSGRPALSTRFSGYVYDLLWNRGMYYPQLQHSFFLQL